VQDHKEDRWCEEEWKKAEREGRPIPATVQRLRTQVALIEKTAEYIGETPSPDQPQTKTITGPCPKNWRTPIEVETHNQQTSNKICPQNQVRRASGKVDRGSPKLNPRWVETLMGLPLGWCCPSTPVSIIRNWKRFSIGCVLAQAELMNSGLLEMESSPPVPNEPSEPSIPD
jgi:hypothetical protein